ncbi:tRNA (adenine(58)-N(1))-methyltransferase non-catalytic subunit TRM6-like [Glandiceps talaboti]
MSDKFIIKESDYVILRKGKNLVLAQVQSKRKVNLERKYFILDPVIGECYGTTWEITKRTIKKVEEDLKSGEGDNAESSEVGDNRNIVDDNTAQKLSQDEILALKKDGMKGEELIEQIVENSATFKEKNVYTQEKYIKKKKEKHLPLFTILKPTTRLLCEMYHAKTSPRTVTLRYDTMGQILTLGNVHANMKVLVVESCTGLLLGAIMDRMGGFGTLVHLYHGDSPTRNALDGYNFTEEDMKVLHSFPLNQANSLNVKGDRGQTVTPSSKDLQSEESCQTICDDDDRPFKKQRTDTNLEMNTEDTGKQEEKKASISEGVDTDVPVSQRSEDTDCLPETASVTIATDAKETSLATNDMDIDLSTEENDDGQLKRKKWAINPERMARREKRRKDLDAARSIIEQGNFDVFIIASRFDPCPIVMKFLDFLSPSRPFIVYSQFIEPLYECFGKLRESRETVNVKITETWLREYQVLPARTHPKNVMSSTGGYILTGIKIATS